MRRFLTATILFLAIAALAPGSGAELLSKNYVYKEGVTLELGVATRDGLRIDSVRFHAPEGERPSAEVSVSNTSAQSLKVGLAMALFDDSERLLGVASGGTRLVPIKSGRQQSFTLAFGHVNSEVARATTFRVSMESKR